MLDDEHQPQGADEPYTSGVRHAPQDVRWLQLRGHTEALVMESALLPMTSGVSALRHVLLSHAHTAPGCVRHDEHDRRWAHSGQEEKVMPSGPGHVAVRDMHAAVSEHQPHEASVVQAEQRRCAAQPPTWYGRVERADSSDDAAVVDVGLNTSA